MKLRPLQQGDQIALVAPASPFSVETFRHVCEILQGKGFRLAIGSHVLEKRRYLAGQEAHRAADLIQAIKDPAVSAIICIRGGYGSGRLLPWLPFSSLQGNNKLFLGYSDITFLHLAFFSRMQWVTFHGPNLMDANSEPNKIDNILNSLKGDKDFFWSLQDTHILREGVATGVVFGGNLTCLSHLIGTPYLPNPDGAILLLEDCGEAVYRLDRMLNQLKLAGILPRLAGLVLGDFKECGDLAEIHEVAMEHSKPYHFPVIANLPFGHEGRNEVIPLGTTFHLNTYERTFRAVDNPFIS